MQNDYLPKLNFPLLNKKNYDFTGFAPLHTYSLSKLYDVPVGFVTPPPPPPPYFDAVYFVICDRRKCMMLDIGWFVFLLLQLVFCSYSDKDECSEATDDCQQMCTNTPGGYVCSCVLGYDLNSDARTCSKGMWSVCNTCTYTPGGYVCSCVLGYDLNSDAKTCSQGVYV